MLGLHPAAAFSHDAHRVLVQPWQVGLYRAALPKKRGPRVFARSARFHTTLVKKSQEANGGSESEKTPSTHSGE